MCSIACVFHILFIHLSADGHSGYFRTLAIVSGAAVDTGACISLWISVFIFSKYVPVVELVDHMVTLFLVF